MVFRNRKHWTCLQVIQAWWPYSRRLRRILVSSLMLEITAIKPLPNTIKVTEELAFTKQTIQCTEKKASFHISNLEQCMQAWMGIINNQFSRSVRIEVEAKWAYSTIITLSGVIWSPYISMILTEDTSLINWTYFKNAKRIMEMIKSKWRNKKGNKYTIPWPLWMIEWLKKLKIFLIKRENFKIQKFLRD